MNHHYTEINPNTLADVISRLPKDALELRVGFAFFTLFRVWICCAATLYILYVSPWYLVPFAIFLFGTAITGLFVIAHECAHQSFTRNRLVNEIVGTVCLMPLAFPYNCWEVTHNHHHAYSNNMAKDYLWKPLRRSEVDKASSIMRSLLYYMYGPLFFESSIIHHLYQFFLPLVSGRNRWALTRSIIFALIGLIAAIYGAHYLGSISKFFIFPFLVFEFWLSTFTYFHHRNPRAAGWKEEKDWNKVYGSLFATVHVSYPAWIEWLTLDINWHIPHHVSAAIPWYNLRRCTFALMQAYGYKLHHDEFSLELWNETTTKCHVFDPNKGFSSF